jgi:hypothetical protein
VRDRVTYPAARSARAAVRVVRTASILAALPVALLVAAAQSAAAEPTLAQGPAAADLSFGTAGPVGIAAVIFGIGGLVAGLLRRRRLAARSAPPRPVSGARPPTTTPPTTAPTGSDRAA